MNRPAKFAVGGVMLLLLAGGIGAVAFKLNEIAHLRSEQQVLLSESQEARQLADQNAGIARLREENAEVQKLFAENQELPRLRNEARQLRRQAEEVTRLRAENERLQVKINTGDAGSPALPPDFIPRSALTDAGFSTPEATMQTMFWAMSTGNIARLKQIAGAAGANVRDDPEDDRRQMAQMAEQMKNLAGIRIAEKNVISPDEVELGLQSAVDGQIMPMKLKRVGGEWRINQ
jgi:hypothetical protein